jgi:hypothetical protein
MTGGPDGVPQVDEGVTVAVQKNTLHMDEVARCFALAPPFLTTPAPKGRHPAPLPSLSAINCNTPREMQ